MTTTVTLPTWLTVLLALLVSWALLDRLLIPSVRWVLRLRVNRLIDEMNTRLRVRLQPFKLTKREVLLDRLVFDPQVMAAVEAFAAEEGMPRQVALDRVRRYAREIIPSFNAYVYFRFGYWLAKRIGQLLYRVRLSAIDEAELLAVPPEATVVFVMNHRSNMDYVLVSYLVAERAAVSYAVGEWARIWPLQSLIKAMGAYFVRRGSGNPLYRKVLERYVDMATRHGVTQAVYLEGKLSRDGRLAAPRLGLLDYMLRDFDAVRDRDVVFVPVGINYDRTLEDRTLLLDVDPAGRRPSSATALWTTLRFFARNVRLWLTSEWHRFGYACVRFGRPVSAKRFLGERKSTLSTLSREERFVEVGALADHLMAAIGEAIPVVPVALVASVLVDAERPLAALEIEARVFERLAILAARGVVVSLPRQDEGYAFQVGLRMLTLRRMVLQSEGRYEIAPGEELAVAYYANSIVHLLPPAEATAASA